MEGNRRPIRPRVRSVIAHQSLSGPPLGAGTRTNAKPAAPLTKEPGVPGPAAKTSPPFPQETRAGASPRPAIARWPGSLAGARTLVPTTPAAAGAPSPVSAAGSTTNALEGSGRRWTPPRRAGCATVGLQQEGGGLTLIRVTPKGKTVSQAVAAYAAGPWHTAFPLTTAVMPEHVWPRTHLRPPGAGTPADASTDLSPNQPQARYWVTISSAQTLIPGKVSQWQRCHIHT